MRYLKCKRPIPGYMIMHLIVIILFFSLENTIVEHISKKIS